MNSIERVKGAIAFQETDRVPVVAQVFGHAATLAGVPLGDYLQDGELLARCQLRALEYYGYDAVFALMDTGVETEAVGSVLAWRAGQYPYVKSYAGETVGLDQLEEPDPYQQGRMPELLKACGILRREVGDEVLVVGCVLGPMTLATQLLGIEAALCLAVDDPEQFSRLLEFATRVVIRFGVAQVEAGAHLPIVFDPSSTPEVIPAQFYREFVLPHLQQVFAAFQKAGASVNWLHTAGRVKPILPYYSQMGVGLANLDYCVDMQEAGELYPQLAFNGNIKSLSFIQAGPGEIARESSRLLDLFASRGGFILSSGCEIPLESKPENITAMVMAARRES